MKPLLTRIDGPLTVVGNVHGQADALHDLLSRLRRRPDFHSRWLMFLGDFVDRGPDPRGVLDGVLAIREEHPLVTSVCGNHDFALAAALGLVPTPARCNWRDRWLAFYDSAPTFASYGVPAGDLTGLQEAMPAGHRRFLADLPWVVEHPSYLLVHAGLLPDVPFAEQLYALSPPGLRPQSPAVAMRPGLGVVGGAFGLPANGRLRPRPRLEGRVPRPAGTVRHRRRHRRPLGRAPARRHRRHPARASRTPNPLRHGGPMPVYAFGLLARLIQQQRNG